MQALKKNVKNHFDDLIEVKKAEIKNIKERTEDKKKLDFRGSFALTFRNMRKKAWLENCTIKSLDPKRLDAYTTFLKNENNFFLRDEFNNKNEFNSKLLNNTARVNKHNGEMSVKVERKLILINKHEDFLLEDIKPFTYKGRQTLKMNKSIKLKDPKHLMDFIKKE
jgi:hypothetical protein